MSALSLVALGTILAAAPLRVAVMPLTNGDGVSSAAAATLTQMVVAEVRRGQNVSVIAQDEIQQALSLDQQRQLLGCADDRCRVEAGNALGAELMVLGSLSRLGESWLMHLKLMDVQKVSVLKEVDRRQKGGNVDDLMDALPGMVGALMSAAPAPAPAAAVPVTAAGSAPVAAKAKPVNTLDKPLERKLLPAKVRLATDGAGLTVAYEDGWGSDWPLYSSRDGKTFVASRVFGRSKDGDNFDLTFWDPRAPARYQASFFHNDEGLFLMCGEQKVPFTVLADKDAAAQWSKATVLQPRWKRYPHALVRDDLGVYWFVDGKRDVEGREDLRLYRGKKGALVALQVDDAVQDPGEDILVTPTGRLKLDYGAKKATWIEGGAETALKWLDVESNARMVYLELGPYKGEPLGTPCDGRF